MKGLVIRSWPMLEPAPWPQMKPTSSPSGSNFSVMDLISVAWLPPGKSVRPTEPLNRTSPPWAKRNSLLKNTTLPAEWPGQCRILHCPGHSAGSVVFFNKELRFAHGGDVLFNGSVGRTDLPGGSHATLIKSITEKLLPLGDDVGFICGHGAGSSIGHERISNPFLNGTM